MTSDVLTSIRQTEDSLLRLKRIKKSEGTSVSSSAESGKITDDDKIRLQFALDTEEFGKQVKACITVSRCGVYTLLNRIPSNGVATSVSANVNLPLFVYFSSSSKCKYFFL